MSLSSKGKEYDHAYLVQCADCGLVFGKRIPEADELQAHYAQYTRDNTISPITVARYEELLDQFEPFRKLNRILDIGCGDGHFLAVAKKKGWNVSGTEYTDEAVRVSRSKGIEIHQGSIQDYAADQFDVITSFEVLEHINDGKEHSRKIASLLRDGGLFYFTTPNFNSFSRKWLGGKWNVIEYPEHLTYYTVRTITKLLISAGFERKSMRTTGFSPQRFKLSTGTATRTGNSDESLRNAIEEKIFLRLAKNMVNAMLNLFRSGDTLKGFFIKR
ncbi:MAG: class I SAM-dependent methyltransferase [Bacteroidota bacterium]|nr:class I SAM-dependent methyltransferase [Bacteroidota bacterium]